MTAIVASFLGTAVKFLVFAFLAWGGVICGKKYRDHKDAISASHVADETK